MKIQLVENIVLPPVSLGDCLNLFTYVFVVFFWRIWRFFISTISSCSRILVMQTKSSKITPNNTIGNIKADNYKESKQLILKTKINTLLKGYIVIITFRNYHDKYLTQKINWTPTVSSVTMKDCQRWWWWWWWFGFGFFFGGGQEVISLGLLLLDTQYFSLVT